MGNKTTGQSPDMSRRPVSEDKLEENLKKRREQFARATDELRYMAAHLSKIVPALEKIHGVKWEERLRAHEQAELMIYGMLVQIPQQIQKHIDTLRVHLIPIEVVSYCYVEDVLNDKFWEPSPVANKGLKGRLHRGPRAKKGVSR